MIVHGSGLDEIALHAETRAIRLDHGEMTEIVLTPEDAGVERAPLSAVAGGDAADNARQLRDLLEGGGSTPERAIVAMNSGALLMTAGLADDLRSGTATALAALSDGAAGKVLARYIEASNG